MISLRTFPSLIVAAIFVPSLLGCLGNADGPGRYAISGDVTYDGQPLAVGEITFEPDRSLENSGPATTLQIRDGKYDSRNWKGVIGGPMIVRILGFDGVQPAGEEGAMQPNGRLLFEDYVEAVELPRASSTRDFAIPAQPLRKPR